MTDAPLAAVTGGTGFLGRHVVSALARDGWRVRMLVRGETAPPAEAPSAETMRGDLADPAALRRLVAGAGAVVHLAGLTKARRRAEFLSTNRDGSARLAAAVAEAAPEARLILVSSLSAREPQLSAYAESKRAGETAAQAALGGTGRWVVLRPAVIYGPGDREGLALCRTVSGPIVPVPRAPEPRIGFVHAADVASAVLALCRAGPLGTAFEVTDERHDGYGWREILHLVGGLLKREPRLVTVPDGVIRAAGAAADSWAAVTGHPALLGRGKAREILHRNWASSPERQLPRPIWAPRIPILAGMQETVAWWSSLGLTGAVPRG
ncbi:NAD-dependent epimerase/dehydratase family protein [Roseomonas sp. WA12]